MVLVISALMSFVRDSERLVPQNAPKSLTREEPVSLLGVISGLTSEVLIDSDGGFLEFSSSFVSSDGFDGASQSTFQVRRACEVDANFLPSEIGLAVIGVSAAGRKSLLL